MIANQYNNPYVRTTLGKIYETMSMNKMNTILGKPHAMTKFDMKNGAEDKSNYDDNNCMCSNEVSLSLCIENALT